MYVAHAGGWGQNNLISVISGVSVEKTIIVGDVPNSMVVVGDYLYVLASGKPEYSGEETAGSLTKIDLNTHEIVEPQTFEVTQHPSQLVTDGVNLYYNLSGSVHKTEVASISVPGTSVIDRSFYTLAINDGMLFGTDAGDYASQGTLYVYDLATYGQIKEISTGIRSEEHTSELQSRPHLVCRLLLEKKNGNFTPIGTDNQFVGHLLN